jgi:hypothetical protein
MRSRVRTALGRLCWKIPYKTYEPPGGILVHRAPRPQVASTSIGLVWLYRIHQLSLKGERRVTVKRLVKIT